MKKAGSLYEKQKPEEDMKILIGENNHVRIEILKPLRKGDKLVLNEEELLGEDFKKYHLGLIHFGIISYKYGNDYSNWGNFLKELEGKKSQSDIKLVLYSNATRPEPPYPFERRVSSYEEFHRLYFGLKDGRLNKKELLRYLGLPDQFS